MAALGLGLCGCAKEPAPVAPEETEALDEVLSGEPPKKSFDYYHLNSVEILPETPLGDQDARFRAGNILVCLRNAHLILVLDQDTLEVTWSWGPGELSFPHMPTMLGDGNILVFDNGVTDENSRVLEIEPVSNRIVWAYEGEPRRASSACGGDRTSACPMATR